MFISTKLSFISLMVVAVSGSTVVESDEQRLVNSLFRNYNKNLRPVLETADVVNVTLNPALFSIVGTDEALESITMVLWLKMNWIDSFLQWNSTEFGGLNELLIPVSKIWYPDVTVLNMIDVEMPISDEKNFAIIEENGTVYIAISQVLTMQCKFHIIMFPFDIQNCTLEAASWMFYPDKVDVSYSNNIDMTAFHPNSEWDLISIFARKDTDSDERRNATWGSVYYDIIIQRKPIYYLLTFVLPCFMITSINIVGIFSPYNDAGDREEKVTMGLSTLLNMTVILTLIADKMPKSSEGMPLLGTYILLQIGIAAVTSLNAVIIIYHSRKWNFGKPIPTWILMVTQLNLQEHHSHRSETKTADDLTECYKLESTNENVNYALANVTNKQIIILTEIQFRFHQILEQLHQKNKQENLQKDWQLVYDRLEFILMFIYLALNLFVTVVLLAVGYSNEFK